MNKPYLYDVIGKRLMVRLYVERNMTIRAIGALLSCHCTTILDKLIKFNIPRRPRYESILASWKEGKCNPGKGRKVGEVAGDKNPFYGKKHTPEVLERIRRASIGRVAWNKGLTKETSEIVKMNGEKSGKTLRELGLIKLDKNPKWNGGTSFYPYPIKWNDKLRKSIRDRDNNTCQICGASQTDKKHDVHHIDYNKDNLCHSNLITLCKKCHLQTNSNRERWIEYFSNNFTLNKDSK